MTTLSVRNKWCGVKPLPMIGDMVLFAEVPRARWAIGRTLEILPGSDNLVHMVPIMTMKGVITRSVARVHLVEEGLTLLHDRPDGWQDVTARDDPEKPGDHYRHGFCVNDQLL
ncbi:hypothetical protein D918_07015 [Trichuris suis]|nr:hypothetical protein D918_07015 [Trichuris suis]